MLNGWGREYRQGARAREGGVSLQTAQRCVERDTAATGSVLPDPYGVLTPRSCPAPSVGAMTNRHRALGPWIFLLPVLLASLVVACGGSDAPAESAVAEAEADQAAQVVAEADANEERNEAAGDAADEAVADNDADAEGEAVAVVTGAVVTGAPVPPLTAGVVQEGASRTATGGNRFEPLNDPRVVLPEDATWLSDDTLVLGAVQNDDARAYPIFMMAYHHVANDVLGGQPYLVTF